MAAPRRDVRSLTGGGILLSLLLGLGMTECSFPSSTAFASPADGVLPSCSAAPAASSSEHRTFYYLCNPSVTEVAPTSRVPPRVDPKDPPLIDWAHYPEDSKLDHEEGWCLMTFEVREDGRVDRAQIKLEHSTGSVALDFKCMQAAAVHFLPAALHGRAMRQTVGIVGIWGIEGPPPQRPKEQLVTSLCPADQAAPSGTVSAKEGGRSFLQAVKLAADKGWLLDPCFFTDASLTAFFGATELKRFYGTDSVGGRWESSLIISPKGASAPAEIQSLVLDLRVSFSADGIKQTELRMNGFEAMNTRPTSEDVVAIYGKGKSEVDEVTDGGPNIPALSYDQIAGVLHSQTRFGFDGSSAFYEIVTVDRNGAAAAAARAAALAAERIPPPIPIFHPPVDLPPGELRFVITDLDVFDVDPAGNQSRAALVQQMKALECCAVDIPKLFSGFRLQVRAHDLSPWLPPANRAAVALLAGFNPLRGVNRRGDAVGIYTSKGSQYPRGYVVHDGTFTDIGTLGGPMGDAEAINECGQVTGTSSTLFDSGGHVFIYQNGVMKDLGPGEGHAISQTGIIAGLARPESAFGQQAAIWERGKRTFIGENLSDAFGVNSSGEVVGEYYNHEQNDQPNAFLWRGGERTNLQRYLIQPRRRGLSNLMTTAAGINDAGQIIVYESNSRPVSRGGDMEDITYLLTPTTVQAVGQAMHSVSASDRQSWLERCNALSRLRGIDDEDRPRYLELCMQSSALPLLKSVLEKKAKPAACRSLQALAPRGAPGAATPYHGRIPATQEQLLESIVDAGTVNDPTQAARKLEERLHITLARRMVDGTVHFDLRPDPQWRANLGLWSDKPTRWFLNASGIEDEGLLFIIAGKPDCLRIGVVDNVLGRHGFVRSDVQMPLAGTFTQWQRVRGSSTFSIRGRPHEECLLSLDASLVASSP
jgi:probable HAF family extracellular repeat protein